jgi:hypothetical protein
MGERRRSDRALQFVSPRFAGQSHLAVAPRECATERNLRGCRNVCAFPRAARDHNSRVIARKCASCASQCVENKLSETRGWRRLHLNFQDPFLVLLTTAAQRVLCLAHLLSLSNHSGDLTSRARPGERGAGFLEGLCCQRVPLRPTPHSCRLVHLPIDDSNPLFRRLQPRS